jgi:hypothetical protein
MDSHDDASFEEALKQMSNVDARILDWLKLDEEKDQIFKVNETIAMLHSHAAFASLALGET